MNPTRTRLAVLISVLGAGLSASHRAWAEDELPAARGAWGAASGFADDTSPTHRMDDGALDRRLAFAAPSVPALPALPAPAPLPQTTREASALAPREPTAAEDVAAPEQPCEPPDDGPEPSTQAAAGVSAEMADAVAGVPGNQVAAETASSGTAPSLAPSGGDDESASHVDAATVVAGMGLDALHGEVAASAADAANAAAEVPHTAGSEPAAIDDRPVTETGQAVAPDDRGVTETVEAVAPVADSEAAMERLAAVVVDAPPEPVAPSQVSAVVAASAAPATLTAGVETKRPDVAAAAAAVEEADASGVDARARLSAASPRSAKAGQRDRAERREPRTVVASQAEKVLANLSTVLADSAGHPALLERPNDHFLVASHEEQVLLALAAVLTDGAALPPGAATTAGDGPRAADVPDAATDIDAVDIELPLDLGAPLALPQPAWGLGDLVATPALDIDLTLPEAAPSQEHAAAPATAAPALPNPLGTALALGPTQLDDLRGGFTTNEGLKVSFGIERATYINGNLVTTTSFNVADPSRPATAQPATGSGERNTLSLVQNGPGNSFQAGPLAGASVGTVIQNTLNDQKIQNVTVINATVNSLQLLRNLNLQSSLRGAVIDSLRR